MSPLDLLCRSSTLDNLLKITFRTSAMQFNFSHILVGAASTADRWSSLKNIEPTAIGWCSVCRGNQLEPKWLRKNNYYYVMLCFAMLCFALLCYAMLCFAMLCYATLRFATLCYALLCYAMLCDALLCFAMLCYAMLCYALLWENLGRWFDGSTCKHSSSCPLSPARPPGWAGELEGRSSHGGARATAVLERTAVPSPGWAGELEGCSSHGGALENCGLSKQLEPKWLINLGLGRGESPGSDQGISKKVDRVLYMSYI